MIDLKLGILPSLNKDYILAKVSQEQIFEYYLQVEVQTDYLIKCPSVIRVGDNNPTFSFYYSMNGKLRARDWAGYFHGDCFDIVAYIENLKSNDKKSFAIILDKVARDFRLHKYSNLSSINTGNTYDSREVIKAKPKTVIQFQPRNWNKVDADFWKAGNISSRLLEEGKVYPCQFVWINNQPVYTFYPKDPAYAYFFSQNEIKVYFPMRKEYRFLSNTNYLQGVDTFKANNIGIITKSYKDVLALKSFQLQAIAPSSETVVISKIQWEQIKNKCNHWYSLMDFDRTGILMASKLRKLYGIEPLFFSQYKSLQSLRDKKGEYRGLVLAEKFKSYPTVKDFFDYVKAYGKESTSKLIEETKNYLKIN